MPATETSNYVNGINMDVLKATVSAIQADPVLGQSRFRVTNRWIGGNHNCTTVTGFYGAKQELAHKQPFELHADEPPILAGSDEGANPVEHLLHALASCVTTSMVAHAAVKGIRIEELESHVEGNIDLRGFLGLDAKVPKGYTNIRVLFKVKSDEENLLKLKKLAMFSPVFNSLTYGTMVDIQVERK